MNQIATLQKKKKLKQEGDGYLKLHAEMNSSKIEKHEWWNNKATRRQYGWIFPQLWGMQRFFKHDTKGNIRVKTDKLEYIKCKNFHSFEDVKIMTIEATECENLFFSILVQNI